MSLEHEPTLQAVDSRRFVSSSRSFLAFDNPPNPPPGNVIEEDSTTFVTAQIFQQSSTTLKGIGRSLRLSLGKTAFSGLFVNLAADCMQMEFRAVHTLHPFLSHVVGSLAPT
jgi:hypothetical protein